MFSLQFFIRLQKLYSSQFIHRFDNLAKISNAS